jgi:hypothetical protein
MSGGGGKGGSKKTETTIPEWVRAPADRNLQRAEAVQQIKYMPYTGGQVAALTPTQEAAMNNNISTAQAFGLLDPNSTLTATSGMPTPTTYDNGMKGYGSIGLYDQALAELTARDPANMAAYNNLFGNVVPANVARGGGGRRSNPYTPIKNKEYSPEVLRLAKMWDAQDKERDRGTGRDSGVTQAQNYWKHASPEVNPQNKGKTTMGTGKNYAMSYNPLTGKGGF